MKEWKKIHCTMIVLITVIFVITGFTISESKANEGELLQPSYTVDYGEYDGVLSVTSLTRINETQCRLDINYSDSSNNPMAGISCDYYIDGEKITSNAIAQEYIIENGSKTIVSKEYDFYTNWDKLKADCTIYIINIPNTVQNVTIKITGMTHWSCSDNEIKVTINKDTANEKTLDGKTLEISGKGSMPEFTTVSYYNKTVGIGHLLTHSDDKTGSMLASFPWFNDQLAITEVIIGDNITSIGTQTFRKCVELTDVSLPNTIKSLGGLAFGDCPKIKTIDLSGCDLDYVDAAFLGISEESIIKVSGPEDYLLFEAGKTHTGANTTITFDGIENSKLADSDGFSGFIIPGTKTCIISGYSGSSTAITIPTSMKKTTSGEEEEYTVVKLASGLFQGKTNITSITINNEKISELPKLFVGGADKNPVKIESLTAPYITVIGESALTAYSPNFNTINIDWKTITYIGSHGLANLKSGFTGPCTFSDKLSYIGTNAFKNMNYPISFEGGDYSGLVFEKDAFFTYSGTVIFKAGCTGIDDLLSAIASNSSSVSSVKKIVIYSSETNYTEYSIDRTNNTVSIRFLGNYDVVDNWQGYDVSELLDLSEYETEDGIVYLKDIANETISVIRYNGSDRNITLEMFDKIDTSILKLTKIANQAFEYNTTIQSIEIPKSVEVIGDKAFHCDSTYPSELTTIIFEEGSSLKSVGYQAFYNCNKLTEISFPSSLTEIKAEAFRWADGVEKITISSPSITLGKSPFLTGWSKTVLDMTAVQSLEVRVNDNFEAFRVKTLLVNNDEIANIIKNAKSEKGTLACDLSKTTILISNGGVTGSSGTDHLTGLPLLEKNNFVDYYWTDDQGNKVTGTLVVGTYHSTWLDKHTVTITDKVDATQKIDGTMAYWTCSVCGKHFSDQYCTQEIADLNYWKENEGKIPMLQYKLNSNVLTDVQESISTFSQKIYNKGTAYASYNIADWKEANVITDNTAWDRFYIYAFDFEDQLTKLTIGENTYIASSEISLSIGMSAFIVDRAFIQHEGKVYIALPIIALEGMNNTTIKVNGTTETFPGEIVIPVVKVDHIGWYNYSESCSIKEIEGAYTINLYGNESKATNIIFQNVPKDAIALTKKSFSHGLIKYGFTVVEDKDVESEQYGIALYLSTSGDVEQFIGQNLDYTVWITGKGLAQVTLNYISDENKHTLIKTASKEATCTSTGNNEYWTCSMCSKHFSDEGCTKEIIDLTAWKAGDGMIAMKAHAMTHHDAVSATCEATGNLEYWACSACLKNYDSENGGNVLATVDTPKIAHTYGEPTYTWNGEQCTASKTCSACVDTAEGHSVTKTVTAVRTTVTAATCAETGQDLLTATFSIEGFDEQTKTVDTEKIAHTLVQTPYKAPTYNSTGNNEYWTCSVCHKIFKSDKTTETTIQAETIPKLTRPVIPDNPRPPVDPKPPMDPNPPVDPKPEEPVIPTLPDKEDGKHDNEDGSSTTITTDNNGNKTVVNEKPIKNGKEKEEQRFDKEGNYQGSTVTTNTEETKDNGDKVKTESVEIKNDTGSTTSKVTNTESISEDGSIRTITKTEEDGAGNTSSQTDTTITVSIDTVNGKVDDKKVQNALDQMNGSSTEDSEKTVTIITEENKGQVNTVTISPESMKAIADTGAQIRMGSQTMTVDLTDDVVTNLSGKNGDISLSIGYADKDQLTDQQKKKVGDSTLLTISTKAGDESIHQLGGKVTVTLPYELKDDENPNSVKVYYVDNDGNLTQMVTKYDAATKTVSFETTHFSYYMIGDDGSMDEPIEEDEGSGNNITMIAGIAIVIVAIICVGAFVMYRRH